jgi:S1-C subfamily serine protease
MIHRRLAVLLVLTSVAALFFTLGLIRARADEAMMRATFNAELDAIRAELRQREGLAAVPAAMDGERGRSASIGTAGRTAADPVRARMVDEIKQELQNEMGLLPLRLLRERRSSFVELYAYDTVGRTNYGTAGYLGHGYFITVKHAVVALADEDGRRSTRKVKAIRIVYRGRELPATVVDTGDATVEVDSGDWAIIKTSGDLDLPALHVDTAFDYAFADPIFRLGNDYSKGIILSTGYVGERTSNGLVTCLTDGHPGVSGGGVLDQRGDLVGIPIGRMQGDFRFSFILPLRPQMLRKVPGIQTAARLTGAPSAAP